MKTDFADGKLPLLVEETLNDFLNMVAFYHFNIGINEMFILRKYDYAIDNSKELSDAGVDVPTKFTLSSNSFVELSKDFIDEYPDNIKKLNKSKNKKLIDNVLRQFRMAYAQDDPFIRYEQLWITLMTILNYLKPDPNWNDKKSISDFSCGATSVGYTF